MIETTRPSNIPPSILYGGIMFGDEERQAVNRVLDRNQWALAEEGMEFQKELADVHGLKNAVYLNSGSSALEVGIRSLNLLRGSEVVVPACTWSTPIASIIRDGLVPVVADVELENYFMSPESLEESITDKTSAVLLVYAAGSVGKLDEVLEITDRYNLKVIEDNCDGLGGTWRGKMLGSFSDLCAISMQGGHIISTGEGGALLTNDDQIARKALAIRDHGRILEFPDNETWIVDISPEQLRFSFPELGSNLRPLELQAAMGRVQLRRLPEFKRRRQENFQVLMEYLEPVADNVILPKSNPNSDPCWHNFPVTLTEPKRRSVVQYLDKMGIEWRPILAGNISRQPAFRGNVLLRSSTPNADKILQNGFWVSVHPQYSKEVMSFLGSTLREAISQASIVN